MPAPVPHLPPMSLPPPPPPPAPPPPPPLPVPLADEAARSPRPGLLGAQGALCEGREGEEQLLKYTALPGGSLEQVGRGCYYSCWAGGGCIMLGCYGP